MYGDITMRVAEQMRRSEIAEFFAKLIQLTSPKSYAQAMGEVHVTTKFLENFCGDQVMPTSHLPSTAPADGS
jgi:1-pyrroline-5-carboxylate dehydrogenase